MIIISIVSVKNEKKNTRMEINDTVNILAIHTHAHTLVTRFQCTWKCVHIPTHTPTKKGGEGKSQRGVRGRPEEQTWA